MPDTQTIVHLIGSLGQFDDSYKLRELVAHQVSWRDQVTVVALSANREQTALQSAGVTCRVIRKRWGYDPFAARQLVQTLQELQPTTVFLWGRRATDAAITVRRALPDANLVATLAKLPQLRNPWWPNKSLDVLDAIVVERDETRAEFIDAGQGEQKMHVIRPGVASPTADSHSRRELLLHLGLVSESRIIAIAGPLERCQLVDEAIWCFELIRILHDHAALVIVGDGPERARLERFARQVTDANVVRFVPNAELLGEVLAHAEIYWQPGTGPAISSALLCAMSCGLPVIASDSPVNRCLIESGENGFLVPSAKRAVWARHTDQLMRDAGLRRKLGQAARQAIVEKFSLAAMIEAYGVLGHAPQGVDSGRLFARNPADP